MNAALPAGQTRGSSASAPLLVTAALALTLLGPLALLLLTPLVLGVPHVVGDLRCLVLSPSARALGLPKLALFVPLAALTALSAAPVLGLESWPRTQLICGAAAVLGAILGAGHRARWRLPLAVGVLVLAALACWNVALGLMVLAHAHNLIAFLWYCAWARNRREAAIAFAAYALAATAIFSGLAAAPVDADFAGLSSAKLAAQLAPGASAPFGRNVVASFAFAQAVHYGVWIWLLPRERATSLRQDLGARGLRLFLGCSVLVPLLGLCDPVWARDSYLALASFHGWLELAVLAFLLSRRSAA